MDELKESRKKGIPFLNATAEKLLSSRVFRDAALNRRCLVPATHFYDWRQHKIMNEKKENSFPYCVTLKDYEYFYMAGIWQTWTDKNTGEMMNTFAIVTTQANSLMQQVHNKKRKNAGILTEDLAYEWIFDPLSEERLQQIASFKIPSAEMNAFTIRKDFKMLADTMEPYQYDLLPELI